MTASVHFDRRNFLQLVGAGALTVAVGSLIGCTSEAVSTAESTTALGVKLPTFKEMTAIKPDLVPTTQGVLAGFYNMPSKNPASVATKPGKGQTVSAMANIFYSVPPGPSNNAWWAGLNERMGVNLTMSMVPYSDYATKFATTIAGNDLPDMMLIPNPTPHLAELLEARFTDLSKYLSGDAILDYPNLASLPTQSWRNAVFNGGIYGIPIVRGRVGGATFIRKDIFDKHGANSEPKSYDEFVEMSKALTDAKARRWAFGVYSAPLSLLGVMNGVPNNWRESGGKLTRSYETEEFRQTVSDLIKMWKSGVMHPDAFSATQPDATLFGAGTTAISYGGYAAWNQLVVANSSNPDFDLQLMPTYERTGGKLGQWWLGGGAFSINAFKKSTSPDQIKLLLRVCDYLSAPFGSEEYLYRLYGQEGRDHRRDAQGNPVLTAQAQTNTVVPIRYLSDSTPVLYQPGRPKDVDVQHAYQSTIVPTGIMDPTVGLYSNSFANKNATIDKAFLAGLFDIVQGRKSFSDLDTIISTWKTSGGNDIRREYEKELQKA